jgi:hypothetical protein
MDGASQRRYVGDYVVEGIPVTISQADDGLILDGYHFSYRFRLLPISHTMFRIEDIDLLLVVDLDVHGKPSHLAIHKSLATYDLYRLIKDRGISSASEEFPSFGARISVWPIGARGCRNASAAGAERCLLPLFLQGAERSEGRTPRSQRPRRGSTHIQGTQ